MTGGVLRWCVSACVFLYSAIDLLCAQSVCNFMWIPCHFKRTHSAQCGAECSETKLSGHSLLASVVHAYITINKISGGWNLEKLSFKILRYPLRWVETQALSTCLSQSNSRQMADGTKIVLVWAFLAGFSFFLFVRINVHLLWVFSTLYSSLIFWRNSYFFCQCTLMSLPCTTPLLSCCFSPFSSGFLLANMSSGLENISPPLGLVFVWLRLTHFWVSVYGVTLWKCLDAATKICN